MDTILNKINREILEYSEKGLLNTDDVSNGLHSFAYLYTKIFFLEQALEKCKENVGELTIENIKILK